MHHWSVRGTAGESRRSSKKGGHLKIRQYVLRYQPDVKALADSINEEFNGEYEYVYDRSNRREQRPKKEIGISSVRGGTIVGDHDVIFAGADEVVTFSHTAYSKAVFGKGAVQAAKFLAGKPAGMYNMSDVINAAM